MENYAHEFMMVECVKIIYKCDSTPNYKGLNINGGH
jgi:hypothetical protein